MQYRTFDKIGERTSLLGMGVMRLPLSEDGSVNEEESVRLLRAAIDGGINYIDTGYTYHGDMSEILIGRALKDGYRDRVLLADKLPIWMVEKEEDVRTLFAEQLRRLDTSCIDMYLIHSLTKEDWETTKNCRVLQILEELQAEGRIRHIGFSFHDDYDVFQEIVDSYDWDFCQIQLNYTDTEFQAGLKGLQYAGAKGLGVVIMEPLKGGRLTDAVPPAVQEIWDSASVRRTPAEWAFKWVASQPEVTCILSGMSTMDQLEQNIALFSRRDIGVMTDDDRALIDKVAGIYRDMIKYPCTECRYCMPCPNGVLIPRLMRYYNDWCAYEHNPKLKEEYLQWQEPTEHASNCVKCGACESHCPQKLPIMHVMDEIVKAFGR